MNQYLIDNFVINQIKKEPGFLLVNDNKGNLFLFNTYTIIKSEPNLFEVSTNKHSKIEYFTNQKIAVIYCIFEHYKKYNEAIIIKDLDRKLSHADTSAKIHNKLLKKATDIDQKILYATKYKEDILLKSKVIEDLDYFINISKYWVSKNSKV